MIIDEYSIIQLFVSILGLLGASLYFYRLNFLSQRSRLIFCFFLLEEVGIFLVPGKILFFYMPVNYLLIAFFLTISSRLFVSSVFLTMFVFVVDQLSRVAVDGFFLFYEIGSLPIQNPARWLLAFTMLRMLFFFMQKRFYDWFIYRSQIFQFTAFLKNRSVLFFGVFFFIFFLSLKTLFYSPLTILNRFYLTITSILLTFILLMLGSTLIVIKKQKQQLQLYSEKIAAEEATIMNIQTLSHDFNNTLSTLAELIKLNDQEEALAYISSLSNYIQMETPVRNYHKIEQLKNRWIQHYLITALKKCQEKNIPIEMDIQELNNIRDDFMIIDVVRCLSIVFDNAIEACSVQKKPGIMMQFYIEDQYFDCKITNTIDNPQKHSVNYLEKGYTTKAGHQGIGLSSLELIISKYQQGEFDCKQTETEFCVQFILRNH